MQSSYVTTHISTVFPLTATRPAGYKFRASRADNRELARIETVPVVAQPTYATEADVTSAIAAGTFKGFATEAYAAAKRYQAYLKAIAPRKFFRRSKSDATKVSSLNFVAGYASA